MKRIIVALLVLVTCLLALLYFNGASRDVEFSFTETGIGKYRDAIKPIKFAIIADVHFRETAREEITDERGTRDILDTFITSMNTEIKPDFIVQLGDFADGCLEHCGLSASEELILDRIQKAKIYTKGKTDITWFDVIGNHEYKGGQKLLTGEVDNQDYSAVYRAINKDWNDLEDTWYYRDIGGYRFIFLNTAFPTEGISHQIPLPQLQWLGDVLESSSQPTFVFMHVPVSAGDASDYDIAINQEKVADLLAKDDSFVAGFFGHSHHSDQWDGLRKQFDEAGNMYFHVPAPHEWMGDRSGHPWVIVTIEPDQNGYTVEVGTGVKRSELSEIFYSIKESLAKKISRLNLNLKN